MNHSDSSAILFLVVGTLHIYTSEGFHGRLEHEGFFLDQGAAVLLDVKGPVPCIRKGQHRVGERGGSLRVAQPRLKHHREKQTLVFDHGGEMIASVRFEHTVWYGTQLGIMQS